ncbi:uncharacterized protein UTRI_02273 [Ustilago trichophora]|uniref:Protein kinase domain-containing protein n=1 Tax=Ustilago trichophora TaxID=86804 RepID=A0A5C3E9W5_9BASI|nr:uncharacterized protein UTRI_02273 [Ustilago trichophora]
MSIISDVSLLSSQQPFHHQHKHSRSSTAAPAAPHSSNHHHTNFRPSPHHTHHSAPPHQHHQQQQQHQTYPQQPSSNRPAMQQNHLSQQQQQQQHPASTPPPGAKPAISYGAATAAGAPDCDAGSIQHQLQALPGPGPHTPKSPVAHFSSALSAASAGSPANSPNKTRGGIHAPSSPHKGALSARNVAAAVFVPKPTAARLLRSLPLLPLHPKISLGSRYSRSQHMTIESANTNDFTPSAYSHNGPATPNPYNSNYDTDPINSSFDPSPPHQPSRPYNPYEHMNEFGDPNPPQLRQPLHYTFTHHPPHVSNLHPHHLTANAFFLNPNQREELQRKQEAMLASVPPPELGGPNCLRSCTFTTRSSPSSIPARCTFNHGPCLLVSLIPRMGARVPTAQPVHLATTAKCLDTEVTPTRPPARSMEAIRAAQARRLPSPTRSGIGLVERWRRIRHPSIVSVREAFTTRAFGDQSIVFVYDLPPLATTLYAEHMTIRQLSQTDALAAFSQSPCKSTSQLDASKASKVLRTGKNRVRINCCSVFDVVAYNPEESGSEALKAQQLEDCISATNDIASSLAIFAGRYSAELKNVVAWLVGQSLHLMTLPDAAKCLDP